MERIVISAVVRLVTVMTTYIFHSLVLKQFCMPIIEKMIINSSSSDAISYEANIFFETVSFDYFKHSFFTACSIQGFCVEFFVRLCCFSAVYGSVRLQFISQIIHPGCPCLKQWNMHDLVWNLSPVWINSSTS